MKKPLIGIVTAAVIGVGGYFAVNQTQQAAANFGDKELQNLITQHQNTPYVIKAVQSHPWVSRADIKVTEATENTIKSLLTLQVFNDDVLEVPLISVITREKVSYQDKSFGYGQIVTTPDYNGIDDLPSFINKDSLVNTTYLGLDGSLLNVTAIAPVDIAEENFSFKGGSIVVNTSLSDAASYDFTMQTDGLNANDDGTVLELSPFEMHYHLKKDGQYTGETSPLVFTFNDLKSLNGVSFDLSQGKYSGVYKNLEGLSIPFSNANGKYDNLTLTVDGTPIKFNDIVIDSGFYENGKAKQLDVKFGLAAKIDENALKASGLLAKSGVNVTPKNLSFNYALTHIGYDVVNLYFDFLSQLVQDEQAMDDDKVEAQVQTALSSLQKTGSGYQAGLALATSEGNIDTNLNITFSEVGKAADAAAFIAAVEQENQQALFSFIDGNGKVQISKKLVQISGAGMYLMMAGAKEDGDNFVIEAKIENGSLIVNDKPMM